MLGRISLAPLVDLGKSWKESRMPGVRYSLGLIHRVEGMISNFQGLSFVPRFVEVDSMSVGVWVLVLVCSGALADLSICYLAVGLSCSYLAVDLTI